MVIAFRRADALPASGGKRESWKADEHMQMEEEKLKITTCDPVGCDEPGKVPVRPGIRIPGTKPAAENGRKVEKIGAGCVS
jgi:hypothetical protein